METKHTAGPWKAQIARSGSNRIQVSGADGRQVALIWRHSAAETEANKLLVRSAPDLLAFAVAIRDSGIDAVGDIDVHELICRATVVTANT